MKNVKKFLLIGLFLLSACVNNRSVDVPSTEISKGEEVSKLIRVCKQYNDGQCNGRSWRRILSADKKWAIITYNTTIDQQYEINSITDPGVILKSQMPISEMGNGDFILISWSPDNTAMVGKGASESYLTAPKDRILIYEINGEKLESSMLDDVFIPLGNMQWSPDSRNLVVVDGYNRLRIIDRKANELAERKINLIKDEEMISAVKWIGNYIYYVVSPHWYATKSFPARIYRIDDELKGDPEKIYTSPEFYTDVEFFSVNENQHSVLINLYAHHYGEEKGTPTPDLKTLVVLLDYQNGRGKEILTGQGVDANSTDSRYVALISNNQLWIYDWEKDTALSYGEVKDVFSWLDSEEGFLVEKVDENGNSYYEVIKP